MHYYFHALWKSFHIRGRASRWEYWSFVAIGTLVILTAIAFDILLDLPPVPGAPFGQGPIQLVISLLHVPASISAASRRIQDTGRIGRWAMLLLFGPLAVVPLLLALLRGTPESNRFGLNPYDDPNNISFTPNPSSIATRTQDHATPRLITPNISELEKIAQMKAAGHLTLAEFEALKSRILNQSGSR